MSRFVHLALGFALWSTAVDAAEPAVLKVDPTQSRIEYTVVHKFHTVVGTSQRADGGIRFLPDGRVMVAVTAPIASFDSKNSGRDEHMQETMEEKKFRNVVFTGTSRLTMPTTFPATLKLSVEGDLDFHGRKRKETVPIDVTFTSLTEAHAVGKFTVSLEKYEVERPSLMLIKIDDACQIALDLLLKQ